MTDIEIRNKIYMLLQQLESKTTEEKALSYDLHQMFSKSPPPEPQPKIKPNNDQTCVTDTFKRAICPHCETDKKITHQSICPKIKVRCPHCDKSMQRKALCDHINFRCKSKK